MQDKNKIIDYLKKTIVEVTLGNVKEEDLTEDTKLMEDLSLDSLDYASVMLAGEEFSGKKLNENDIDWRDIKTIGQLASLFLD